MDSQSWISRVVSDDDLIKYFKAAATVHPDLHDVARLILHLGLRPSEARCIAKADVTFHGTTHTVVIRAIKDPRTRRRLQLDDESRAILQSRMSTAAVVSRWIFPSRTNVTRHRGLLTRLQWQACKRAGIRRFALSDLRSTYLARRLAGGMSYREAAALIGTAHFRKETQRSADSIR